MVDGNVDGTLDRLCLLVLSMSDKHRKPGANVILEKTSMLMQLRVTLRYERPLKWTFWARNAALHEFLI